MATVHRPRTKCHRQASASLSPRLNPVVAHKEKIFNWQLNEITKEKGDTRRRTRSPSGETSSGDVVVTVDSHSIDNNLIADAGDSSLTVSSKSGEVVEEVAEEVDNLPIITVFLAERHWVVDPRRASTLSQSFSSSIS